MPATSDFRGSTARKSQRRVAIVTDGMWRKSVSAIRSLGKAGFDVHVLGDTWVTVGFWSRYTTARHVLPAASQDKEAFRTQLFAYLKAHSGNATPVLLPMEDATLDCVLAERKAVEELVHILAPCAASFRIASDKFATMEHARRLAIPHPKTVLAQDGQAIVEALTSLDSCVVKPVTGSGSRGVRYDPRMTIDEAHAYIERYGAALVQQRISAEGDAIGVALLYDRNKKLVAHFCHKRLLQYPSSGGPSTDRIGIPDGDYLDMSRRLVETLDWEGIAMVEWKVDPASGTPMLMEINPRFWGSLELAVRSDVDFPALYARAAMGEPCSSHAPKVGVRCRWLLPGDVLRYLSAPPSEREGFRNFLRGLPKDAEEWDVNDLRGGIASLFCQGLAVLLPQYRKMMNR